jgi:putative colanic acid biosynthesis acetyltransferase WcaB
MSTKLWKLWNPKTKSHAADDSNVPSISLAEMVELIRWDMRVNRGWSFDHLRARVLLIEIRLEQYIHGRANKNTLMGHLLWSVTRFAGSIFQWLLGHCNIPGSIRIGRGMRLPHPQNIVIAYRAEIGDFCTVYHDVSIVWNGFVPTKMNRPRIGDRVMIGAKALVIGDVEIGDDVLIGAGAIVPKSVPASSRVVNEPARIHHRPITPNAPEAGSPEHLEEPYSIWR